MQIQNLYCPFEVDFLVADECPVKVHKHTYFELVYIMNGTGKYCINDNHYDYQKDDFFMIIPGNGHHTIVETRTSFLFIRFQEAFCQELNKTIRPDNSLHWLNKLDHIFRRQQKQSTPRLQKSRALIRALCEGIIEESSNAHDRNDELLQKLIDTLLTAVVRAIDDSDFQNTLSTLNITDIIHYIHNHINKPSELKVEKIGAHFNISDNYVGEYFKKHSGTNLQRYIIDYRLSMVETRLLHSNLRLGEIAYEFGFTDESHLVRAFRKYKGISPIKFRKQFVVKNSDL